jgi:hypothetical protein
LGKVGSDRPVTDGENRSRLLPQSAFDADRNRMSFEYFAWKGDSQLKPIGVGYSRLERKSSNRVLWRRWLHCLLQYSELPFTVTLGRVAAWRIGSNLSFGGAVACFSPGRGWRGTPGVIQWASSLAGRIAPTEREEGSCKGTAGDQSILQDVKPVNFL